MKIENSVKPVGPGMGELRSRDNRAASRATDNAGAADNVSFSTLASIESAVANAPEINSAKVAEIKQAIAEGRFSINTEAIATRLLSSVQEMLHQQTKA